MSARLVTIVVTISVTMMLGRSMSSEGARFSNGKFGRGDKSYSAHSCLRKTWQACLEAHLSSARRACLEHCRSGCRWRGRLASCLKGFLGRQEDLSGAPGSCLERQEDCLERQEGLSGRPGARLVVLPAAWSAWSAGKTVWSAWRSENIGRSDVLEFPLQELQEPQEPQENPNAPRPRTEI